MQGRIASRPARRLWLAVVLMWVVPVGAQDQQSAPNQQASGDDRSVIVVDGRAFSTWQEYVSSDLFRRNGLRCGTRPSYNAVAARSAGPSDCTFFLTNPAPAYDPSVGKFRIPVVVHVIRRDDGFGDVSEAMVQSQIDILNEDFLALTGTNGQNGTNVEIEFFLATTDPSGSPTNGITYSNNTTWYNDGGAYWNSLAWDTSQYLNIYTNSASGALGYVPDLPQGGIAGSNSDRVVILWSTFGRNAPFAPFDQGRTLTHEVGHYFGLEHTFAGACASVASCNTNGDLICDTNPESSPNFGCSNSQSCGVPKPIENYMDYSDDLCMEQFTAEQARRMRCSLEFYRPALFQMIPATCGDGVVGPDETCDTGIAAGQPGACPTVCNSTGCTVGTLLEPGTCLASCDFSPITQPISGDGCCPPGANAANDNDCVAACGNNVCEPGELGICVDCDCTVDAQCDDSFVCTTDQCVSGQCSYTASLFGDVDLNATVNLFDLFCALDGFGGTFSGNCTFESVDIEPCAGNNTINILDLFAILDAFNGVNACCAPSP